MYGTNHKPQTTNHKPQTTNYGFTLVELSIVLVIIGLLIGGILVGQSLIKSVQIQSVVRDLIQYETLVRTFKEKYKQLPGDSTLFSDSIGNNNGLIWESGEVGRVFYELSLGLGIKNQFGNNYPVWTGATNVSSGAYSPQFDIEQRTSAPGFNITPMFYIFSNTGADRTKNKFIFREFLNHQSGNWQRFDPLLAADTASIDTKIDDSMPDTGNMFVYSSSLSPAQCSVSGVYNVTYTDDYICSIIITMDGLN